MSATPSRSRATVALSRAVVEEAAARHGLTTTDEIADWLGIDRSTYFRLIGGRQSPLLVNARQLASKLEVHLDVAFPVEAVA